MSKPEDDPVRFVQREVERLFHDLVYHRHPSSHFVETPWSPAADLVVLPNGARIMIEVAGVPQSSVRVTLRGRVLEVSGRREPPHEPAEAHYHRAEIYFGNFRRVIELPWDADPDRVEAQYRSGMLEVTLVRRAAPANHEVPVEERGS
jgi:HSP20 family protein